MMKNKQTDWICFGISAFGFLIFSLSFSLMPIELTTVSLASGIMFWLGLLIGVVAQIILAVRRNAWCAANKAKRSRGPKRIGIITFFKNIYAIIADITMLVGLAGVLISIYTTDGTGTICYIFISVFTFAFCMHCILNGKMFYFITIKEMEDKKK